MALDAEEASTSVKTVVIVGAGAAGLQAAKTLLEHEACINGRLKVVLLEARDRIGGRIYIDRKWAHPFDHGDLVRFSF
jgi:monoamine oxidase